ncbi:MAG: hypothetical protein IPK99_16145 [Flavobacteriales bacterium]|nr:hypothetical protein [Flavobacteriales bacterium]
MRSLRVWRIAAMDQDPTLPAYCMARDRPGSALRSNWASTVVAINAMHHASMVRDQRIAHSM